MWRKPGPSGVIRSMLQPGMGQSSFMPRPMGLRPPSPNSSDHHHDPRKARESHATEGGIVLAQRATETKGGELAVLPDLLDGLDLAGCLVSLDALACQPGIAERITDRGGDYLLALKGNRKKAHAEVKAWFAANAFALGGSLRACFDAFDESHGRLVRRRVFACPDAGVFTTLED